jgi:SAM-dependent methyltransferase
VTSGTSGLPGQDVVLTGDPDEHVRRLAAESLAAGDPIGWFDRLYLAAEAGAAIVPWDRGVPQRLLVQWARAGEVEGAGRPALVVGCGLGADAEYLARIGYATTAFDISPAAVGTAKARFPDSPVRYRIANLFDLPTDWQGAYDLVLESLTVQAMPTDLHAAAIERVRGLVRPGGTLLVIAAGREDESPIGGPPWPLTRAEIDSFGGDDLAPVSIEEMRDPQQPDIRRWRAEFRRADAEQADAERADAERAEAE